MRAIINGMSSAVADA